MNANKKRDFIVITVASLATFYGAYMGNVTPVALPKMAEIFGLSNIMQNWVTNIFLLTMGVLAIPLGKLCSRYGVKKTFIYSVILMLIGSIGTPLSHTISELLIFRVIQGIGGAGLCVDSMLLERYRDEIDEIDSEIVRLFEKRMKVSEEVAEYKIKTGKQVLDPARESQKIHTLKNKAHGDFNSLGVQELFRQIMAISRKRQYQLLTEHGIYGERNFTTVKHVPLENATVVFQGVEGAYSYAAMRQYFGKNIESYHVKTWRTAMEDVTHGKADYAVLPIENSTAGIVADIYDLLMEYKLYIVGEQIIRVDHVLLGMPDAQIGDIREVCSHPQGLAQCKAFLEENPSWKKKEVENTAGAAKKVSEVGDKGVAAIASREAGEVFGLKVLAENICREKANSTRFIIVSRKPEYEEKAGKISICFELPHESGTLYNMLSHIIYNGLNMTKIESRPIPGKSWEYRFFVDFTGKLGESAVENALRGIEAEANVLRVLGNY